MTKTPALSQRTKIAYGVADIGASLSYVAVNTWLLYFLINIAGLRPLLAGTVFILGRVFDAVLDPLMGSLSDRLKPRIGRLTLVRWGALPFGLSFALLWLIPNGATSFVFGLLSFMLFSLIYTLVQVPYVALTPDLSQDYDERTSLTSYRIGFGTLASLIAVALPPLIVMSVRPAPELAQSSPLGWLVMGLCFGLLCTLSYGLMATLIREPKPDTTIPRRQNPPQLRELLSLFRTTGFSEMFALFIVITTGLMVVNSVLPFFLESSLALEPAAQPLVLGTLFGVAILVIPLWNRLSVHWGKRTCLILGLALLAVSLVLLVGFSAPGGLSAYLIIMTLFCGVGVSALLLFPWAMMPDIVEFDVLEQGQSREASIYALMTFGQKLAGSVGVFSNALVATVFGYQQGMAAQSAQTVQGLNLMTGPVAAGIFLIAIWLVWRYPITRRRHEQVKKRLYEV